ncbi:MAG: MATE family efflux transporter [Endomicrobiales bacterium]|jgi:MATE family multidrug resistance protein
MYRRLSDALHRRWTADGGYREFITIATPLILSTGSWSLQHFVDRMFLTWYSPAAIAAAMPAGMLNFMILTLFLGTVTYVDTFVAQYYGADQHTHIGPVLWQGLYLSILGGILIAATAPLAGTIFSLVHHPADVMANEIIFFKTLCYGSFFPLAAAVLAGFYAGRGRTWTVMWVNIVSMGVNIVLDYLLIFGHGGFPRLGIQGAAIATVMAGATAFFLYLACMCFEKDRSRYAFGSWRISHNLLWRLLKFGFPNGVQFFVDIAGFTAFIMIMGALGTTALAASSIAFNINTLVFMPMIGSGIAASILVGQYLGRNRPDIAEKAGYTAFHIAFAYMFIISALFVCLPSVFIAPFAAKSSFATFTDMKHMITVLLRFVAVYSLFDAMNMIFSASIKGAGDTRFVMKTIGVCSVGILIVPVYVGVSVFHAGLYTAWAFGTAYTVVIGIVFLLRFRAGQWKKMLVIEHPPAVLTPLPEACSKNIC